MDKYLGISYLKDGEEEWTDEQLNKNGKKPNAQKKIIYGMRF